MRTLPRPLLPMLLLSLVSCGSTEEGHTDFYTGPYAHTEVRIVPGILKVGDTGRAHLMATSSVGVVLGELEARWGGDDDAVATVDSSGLITAHAVGLLALATDIDPHPQRWRLYVSPDTGCGDALAIEAWHAQGGFSWNGAASSGDSAIAAHHTVAWDLLTEPPRQEYDDAVIWRLPRPTSAAEFSFTRRDTLTVGTWRWVEQGSASYADSIPWYGELMLLLPTCKLTFRAYPWTQDVGTLIRPSLPDSVVWNDRIPAPFTSAEVAVGAITGGGVVALGGKIPLTMPSDSDQPFGYGPAGYSAFVAAWHGAGADSVALVQNLTPTYSVSALHRR